MVSILKNHWPIFILGIAIGLLFIYPHLHLRIIDGKYYKGVDVLGSDAETHYVARIQEVYDGHWGLGQTYLWEGKDLPYLQPPFPELVIATLGKLFGFNAIQVNIAAKFIFGFFLAFIIYFFVYEIFGQKTLALASTSFILLGSVLTSVPEIRSLISTEIKNFEFLRYARPVIPATSSLLMFSYFWVAYRLFTADYKERKKCTIICVLAGIILLALSFYTYLYLWTYLLALNALLVFWLFFAGKRMASGIIFLITALALVLAVPYFLNLNFASSHSFYASVSEKFGMVSGRSLIFSKFGALALLVLVFAYFKKLPSFNLFLTICFAAALLVINHQLVTGIKIQNDHYHWYMIVPLASIILLSSFYFYIRTHLNKLIIDRFFAGLIFIFFLVAITVQQKSYFALRSDILDSQRFAPVFSWFNSRAPKDSAVFTGRTFSELIPVYTSNNVYYSGYGVYYLIPEERLLHNFFSYLYFNGVRGDTVSGYLEDNKSETAFFLFGLKYRYRFGCSSCFPDDINNNLAVSFRDFLKTDFISSLKKYRADYIMWDKKENPELVLPEFGLETVYEADDISIYKIF